MKVIKKLGHREEYSVDKIKSALQRTAKSIGVKFLNSDWKELKPRILSRLEPIMKDKEEIYFWEIDDVVIDALLRSRFKDIAKEYIETRSEFIKDKLNDLNLSSHAMWLLRSRYLKKDMDCNPIETAKEMMCRVATAIASVEKTEELREHYTDKFTKILCNLDFLPNSPALVSAGTNKEGTWLACFGLIPDDSIFGIFNVAMMVAKIFQMGGGAGISVSQLREAGAFIKTSHGTSSGPIAFLELYNVVVKIIKAGGFRRGAMLTLLDYYRPDIEEFIHCKRDIKELQNMNISVMLDDKFFEALNNDNTIPLLSPLREKPVGSIPASLILEIIATNMWDTGEPGVLFYNAINKANPTPHLGDIKVCNPCAEATLLKDEACCLGSINLVRHMIDGEIDWDKLAETTKLAVRFLDNILDGSPYPSELIETTVKRTRKIGLGIMGFADILIKSKIKYSSKEAIEMANKIMSFINDVASQTSTELGKEKGIYPAYKDGYRNRRNAVVTTVAPTGSLSLIAGVSSGVEPNIAGIYSREIDGKEFTIVHPLKDDDNFETTYNVSLNQHLDILVEFQKHVENAISKTVNCPENTTVKQIKELIIKAHNLGVKGITIYRDGCEREPLIRCEDCRI